MRPAAITLAVFTLGAAPPRPAEVPRFPFPASGLELGRPTRPGVFYDVVGRRSAVFGYENRGLEAWVYPLKLVDDFRLSFRLEGYPLEIEGSEIASYVSVRPEATTFTYAHSAFTVRQTIFAPLHEPGIVMLLDVDSTLPLAVNVSFRPRLALMWPAGLQTGDLGWDEAAMLCLAEMPVPGGPQRCIRVLIHWNTDLPSSQVHHVYLHAAASLRPDRASAANGRHGGR